MASIIIQVNSEAGGLLAMDLYPEMEFLASKQETGHEWELYKENVRPFKRGRNVRLLNQALKSNTNPEIRKSLFENRKRLLQAIDEYKREDPLQPWLESSILSPSYPSKRCIFLTEQASERADLISPKGI